MSKNPGRMTHDPMCGPIDYKMFEAEVLYLDYWKGFYPYSQ